MRRRLLCSVSPSALLLAPAPKARRLGKDGGLWRAIISAGAGGRNRAKRAPILTFRLFTWSLTVGSFALVGWLIGGWPTAGGAALLSGTMVLPYLLGIKRRP